MHLESLIKRMFAGANEAVLFTDPQGNILEVNQAFSELYQYKRAEVIGKNPKILSSVQTPKVIYQNMWEQILDPDIGCWKGELINRKKNGTLVPVHNYITAIRDEDDHNLIKYFMGIILDLTEQKRLEQKQREQQQRLAYIGEAAAAIAHDMRSPLGVIIGHGELGLRSSVDRITLRSSVDRSLRERLRIMVKSAKRIADMTDEITDTARGEYALSRSEVKIDEFISSLVQDMEERYFLSGIKISQRCDYSGSVQMDNPRMYRAVENLLKNAAEAFNEQLSYYPEINISVRKENGYAIIGVHDNGPGVSPEIEPKLFQIYATSGKHGKGTGIGLNNVKKLAEAHGGTVRYERKDNISSFYLSLPI